MIIERKYVSFISLINTDEKAKEIFFNAFNKSYPPEDRERIFSILAYLCLYERDMGWCFKYLGDVIDGFSKLDIESPYDNGFSYSDVNDVEIAFKSDDELIIHLLHNFDGVKHIVKVEKYTNASCT